MEQIKEMAEKLNERLDAIESIAKDKSEIEALKTSIENAITKEDLEKVTADLDQVASKLETLKVSKTKSNQIAKVEIHQPLKKDAKTQNDFNASMTLKADVLHNLQVISGGTFDADEANADASLLTLTANSPLLSGRLSFSDSFLSEFLSL